MMEVIPVVNCPDQESAERKLREAESLAQSGAEWVHVDVADGRFTFHKTWNDPAAWAHLNSKLSLEVHLMIEEPELAIDAWLAAGAKRVIVHYEAIFEPKLRLKRVDHNAIFEEIAAKCEALGAVLVISMNPETPAEKVVPLGERTRNFQVLAVHPGLAGQNFLKPVLEKIKFLRHEFPDATIEVDGGITPETGKLAHEAGANVVTSDSYLSKHDPRLAFRELRNL
jgi:ribulose-phosphate 3-epimerase